MVCAGHKKIRHSPMLVGAAMNLRKLVNYLWKPKHRPSFSLVLFPILPTFIENIFYFVNSLKRSGKTFPTPFDCYWVKDDFRMTNTMLLSNIISGTTITHAM